MRQWREDSPPPWVSDTQPANETPRRFPITWVSDLQLKTENTDLIKGVIPRGAFVLVYGPSGDGKTFWTIDVAYHIANRTDWRGRRTHKEPHLIIYVAAEAGASIAKRFIAVQQLCEHADGPLGIITRPANLLDPTDVNFLIEELLEEAHERPMDLIIFDTYSRSMPGGDENGSKDPTAVIGAADRLRDATGATVLFVHHSGKDEARGARGHTSLFAAADTVIHVVDKCAEIEKSRDGTTGEKFPFSLNVVELGEDSEGDPITTCTVEQSHADSRPARKKTLSGNSQLALSALMESIRDSGQKLPATSIIPPGTSGVILPTWREQFNLRYGGDDPDTARKSFQRCKSDLLKQGIICIADPYVWIA